MTMKRWVVLCQKKHVSRTFGSLSKNKTVVNKKIKTCDLVTQVKKNYRRQMCPLVMISTNNQTPPHTHTDLDCRLYSHVNMAGIVLLGVSRALFLSL